MTLNEQNKIDNRVIDNLFQTLGAECRKVRFDHFNNMCEGDCDTVWFSRYDLKEEKHHPLGQTYLYCENCLNDFYNAELSNHLTKRAESGWCE